MKKSASIRSSILAAFGRVALESGFDPDPFLVRAGIDPALRKVADAALPMHSFVAMLEDAAVTTGIDDLGLRLAALPEPPDLGPLSLVLRVAEDLRSALRAQVGLIHLHSTAPTLFLAEGDPTILTIDLLLEGTLQSRQIIEASVGSNVTLIRWLLNDSWLPESISFRNSQPASISAHRRFFRCPIDFDQDFNGIVIRKSDLFLPVCASSEAVRREIAQYINMVYFAPSDDWATRVAREISVCLPSGNVSVRNIAGRLGVTTRTLHRHLATLDLNYTKLLESVRKKAAAQFVLFERKKLNDTASLLGFGSQVAFNNWFSRAFGSSPREWRHREQAKRGL